MSVRAMNRPMMIRQDQRFGEVKGSRAKDEGTDVD
jgi:hypothetical protein